MDLSGLTAGIQNAVSSARSVQPSSTSFDLGSYMAAVNSAAAQTNAFNASEAEKNRQWQEYMSNTSHRREMADLEAAGLNPILAARQGASTPSGSSASGADASGAIAGLLGQVLSAQSAQAVANRNNATATLLQTMKQNHDIDMRQRFPDSWASLATSLASAFGISPTEVGSSARKVVSTAISNGLFDMFDKDKGSSYTYNGQTVKLAPIEDKIIDWLQNVFDKVIKRK